jgi:hypothetical protein
MPIAELGHVGFWGDDLDQSAEGGPAYTGVVGGADAQEAGR